MLNDASEFSRRSDASAQRCCAIRPLAGHAIALFDRAFAARKAQHADVGGGSCKRWAVGDVDD
jgi:hypothetical protein